MSTPNLDSRYITQSKIGAVNGVASLNTSSQLTASQLPSAVSLATGAETYAPAPTGNATTDNTNFQAALTAAAGGTLRLHPGTYNLTQAPTIASFTTIRGDKSTVLQCTPASGVFFDLTGLNMVRFEGVFIKAMTSSMTLFNLSSTFNCTFTGLLLQGTHTLASPMPNQIAFSFSNNAGDNYITNGTEIGSFGIGLQVNSYANYLSNSKVANCQYGVYGVSSYASGIIVEACTFASVPGGVTISQIYYPQNGSYIMLSDSDFEGSTNTIQIGSGALNGGPTMLSIINCHIQGTSSLLNIQSAYGCVLVGDSFTYAAGYTPTTLTINPVGAPNGFAAGLITTNTPDNGVILPSVAPAGWVFLGETSSQIPGLSIATALGVPPLITSTGGKYFQGQTSYGTSATLGNGNLKLTPMYINQSCTITALFAEFTAAGDAASTFAPCIYSDSGNGYPGTLLVTGPTISTGTGNAGAVATAGTPGVYQGTVSQALSAGLYWIGGVVQNVTTTQPTFRTATFGQYAVGSSTLPAAGSQSYGYNQSSVTGALPTTFSAGGAAAGIVPRVGIKIA